MIRESVTVTRPATRDRYGDPGTVTGHTEGGCRVWPRFSGDEAEDGAVPLDGWNVMTAPGGDVRAGDLIVVRGGAHRVVGVPAVYTGKGTLVVTERIGT